MVPSKKSVFSWGCVWVWLCCGVARWALAVEAPRTTPRRRRPIVGWRDIGGGGSRRAAAARRRVAARHVVGWRRHVERRRRGRRRTTSGGGTTGVGGATAEKPAFASKYDGLGLRGLRQFNPIINSSCSGTNHQDIQDVEKLVFLGDTSPSALSHAGAPGVPRARHGGGEDEVAEHRGRELRGERRRDR